MISIVPTMGGTRDFNTFLKENGWWIALAVAGLVLLAVLSILIPTLLRRKKKPVRKVVVSEYMDALGGEANIISHELRGSRIVVKLNDYSLLDKEKLKGAGVDSFILMSSKLTLVIRGDASVVYSLIFPQS